MEGLVRFRKGVEELGGKVVMVEVGEGMVDDLGEVIGFGGGGGGGEKVERLVGLRGEGDGSGDVVGWYVIGVLSV